MRNIPIVVFAAATLLITALVAQQAAPADKTATMPMGQMMGNMGQMMGQMNHMMGQMTGQMGPMMASNADAAKLVDQLVSGFAAIENEKDAKVRNEKLAEHGKLLKDLQAKLHGQSQMMEHMHGMMMGGATPAGDKKQ